MSSTSPVDPVEESRKLQPLQGLGALNFPVQPPPTTTVPTNSTLAPVDASPDKKSPNASDPTLEAPQVNFGNYSSFVNQAQAQGFNLDQAGINQNAQEFTTNLQVQMGQITLNVLSKWVQSIQEIGEQQAKTRAQQQVQDNKTNAIKENEKASDENASKAATGAGAVAAGTVLLGGFVLGGMLMPGVAQVAGSAVVPLTSAVQAIAMSGVQLLPAAFTSLVVLFGAGALLQANMLTAASGTTGKKAVNEAFIQNYAKRILATISDPGFNDTLLKLNTDGDTAKTNLQITQAKLVLLGTALALSYKAETGGITGEEFETMVNGTMNFKEGDPRIDLIGAFQTLLNTSGLSQGDRSTLMTNLKKYFNSNPSLDALLEPSNALPGANSVDKPFIPPAA